jgi:hypothetical protein
MRAWVLFFVLISASSSVAADNQWHWIKAGYTIEEYFVSQGNAEVSIEGDKFIAKLFQGNSHTDVQIIIKGVVKNGKITAKETIQGSDYTDSVYEGTLTIKNWDNFAGTSGAESINLSDGWSLIGIKRTFVK